MKLKSFKSTASYQIVDNLYNSQKEFIILGLCGKVGSGVSEVSNILQNKFEDLHLPKPGNELLQKDSYAEHEYRILYNYAEKNWAKFYKIRTSALITRRILTKKLEEGQVFFNSLIGENNTNCDNILKDFFNKEMEIDITSYCEKIHYTPTYSEENWKIIASEKLDAISERQDKKLENTDVHFSINSQTGKITFKNSDLSKLIDYYNKLRSEKTGFNNPLWYVLLKEYIYEYLPLFVKEFWEKCQKLNKI